MLTSFPPQEFHTQTKTWAHIFENQLTHVVPHKEQQVNNQLITVTVDKVQVWVDKAGTFEYHLQWFEAYNAASEFYNLV